MSFSMLTGCGQETPEKAESSEQAAETKETQEESVPAESTQSVTEEESTVEESTSMTSEENTEGTEIEAVDNIRAMYQDMIDDYIAFYNSEKPYNQTLIYQTIGDNSSILNYGFYNNGWLGVYNEGDYFDQSNSQYMYSNALSVDAKFYDTNQDGIEEMFIVESDDGYNATGTIHDVWTIIDGKPAYVSYFDSRFELVLTEEGELKEYGSSGWNSSYCATLTFQEDGYFTTTDIVEQVPEGQGSYFAHNDEKITEEEFNELQNTYLAITRMDLRKLDGINIGMWEK